MYILRKIHEGVCRNHSGRTALAHKVLRQGQFWSTLKKDSCQFVQKCDKCQRFSNVQRQPHRASLQSPALDLSPSGVYISLAPSQKEEETQLFTIVAIDYFIKQVEADHRCKYYEFHLEAHHLQVHISHSLVFDNGSSSTTRRCEIYAMNWV